MANSNHDNIVCIGENVIKCTIYRKDTDDDDIPEGDNLNEYIHYFRILMRLNGVFDNYKFEVAYDNNSGFYRVLPDGSDTYYYPFESLTGVIVNELCSKQIPEGTRIYFVPLFEESNDPAWKDLPKKDCYIIHPETFDLTLF